MSQKEAVQTSRATILATLRRSLHVTGFEAPRKDAVMQRLKNHPTGIIPHRAQCAPEERIALFMQQAQAVSTTLTRLAHINEVPQAIAAYLASKNMPLKLRMGQDATIAAIDWETFPTLEVISGGASDGQDLVALSKACGGIAETGTLALISGRENPTTLNFLPDTHMVVLKIDDMVGDMESFWAKLRAAYPDTQAWPRTVNFITGPSRSGDIEQTILLGAHGPRNLHVLLIG